MGLKRQAIKKEKILNKGLLSDLYIPIIIILSILYFSQKTEIVFVMLIKILCATLSLLIGIIVYTKIPNIKNDLLKYLGIGFFYAGIIHFAQILLINTNTHETIKVTMSTFASYFEFIIIIWSVILYKNKIGILISNIVFIFNLILSLILSKWIVSKIILHNILMNNKEIDYLDGEYVYIRIVIIVLMTIISIYIVQIDKNIEDKTDKLWLFRIILLFASYNIINGLGIILDIHSVYLERIIRLISYGTVYTYVEQKLLNNSYIEILNKLTEIQNIRKNMNNNLMKKKRNLTESRDNIKKSQQIYEEIIDSISDGILIFENNKLTYINRNGLDYICDKLVSESDKIDLKYVMKELTNTEFDNNNVNIYSNGDFIIHNSEDKKIHINLIIRNISNTEKILLIKNTNSVDELQQLSERRDKALVMESIKDEFYSNISHELRTPINVINSALQLNNLMLEENKLDKMSKNNNIIRQNCLRLIRTINNFIDTNRISEGFLEPVKNVYNIVTIIENVVLASNRYMLLSGTELVFDTDLEDIYVECDIDHIERIMLNILSNSLKYGKNDGHIDVEIKSTNSEVSIQVKNDAPPIPDGKKVMIFDKFTKLDSSLARPSEGSGLGLYLSKELVELNGGRIEMRSNIGNVNIFEIRFPIKMVEDEINVSLENNEHNLKEKVSIEFSDIYFY